MPNGFDIWHDTIQGQGYFATSVSVGVSKNRYALWPQSCGLRAACTVRCSTGSLAHIFFSRTVLFPVNLLSTVFPRRITPDALICMLICIVYRSLTAPHGIGLHALKMTMSWGMGIDTITVNIYFKCFDLTYKSSASGVVSMQNHCNLWSPSLTQNSEMNKSMCNSFVRILWLTGNKNEIIGLQFDISVNVMKQKLTVWTRMQVPTSAQTNFVIMPTNCLTM